MSTLDPTTNLPKDRTSDSLFDSINNPVASNNLLVGSGGQTIDYNQWKGVNRVVDGDNEEIRAQAQTGWGLAKNAAIQSLGVIIGGSIEGLGYLGDVFNISEMQNRLKGGEAQFENILTQWGRGLQDYIMEEVAPIYVTKRAQEGWALGDATWWASNAPSIMSSISLMVPAFAARASVIALGKGLNRAVRTTAKGTKLIDNIADTRLLQAIQQPKVASILDHTASSVVSRHIYNSLEARDTFQQNYDRYKEIGYTEEEAKSLAGKAAGEMYRVGYWNIWKDALMWNILLRGSYANRAIEAGSKVRDPRLSAAMREIRNQYGEKSIPAIALGRAGIGKKELLKSALGEGFEEFNIQFQKKRGTAYSEHLAGLSEDGVPKSFLRHYFSRDLVEHAKDRHTWDATFWGTVGGLVFGAAAKTGGFSYLQEMMTGQWKTKAEIVQKELDKAAYISQQSKEIYEAHINNDFARRDAAVDNLTVAISLGQIVEGNSGADSFKFSSAIHDGRFNDNLEDFRRMANTPDSELKTEDEVQSKEVAKLMVESMESVVKLFETNLDSIKPSDHQQQIASIITEHQYLAQRTNDRISEYNTKLEEVKSKMPQFEGMSPSYKTAAELQVSILSLEKALASLKKRKEFFEKLVEELGVDVTTGTLEVLASESNLINELQEVLDFSKKEHAEILRNAEDVKETDKEFYNAYIASSNELQEIESNIKQAELIRDTHSAQEAHYRIPENQKKFADKIEKASKKREAKLEKDAIEVAVEQGATIEDLAPVEPTTKEGKEAKNEAIDTLLEKEEVKQQVGIESTQEETTPIQDSDLIQTSQEPEIEFGETTAEQSAEAVGFIEDSSGDAIAPVELKNLTFTEEQQNALVETRKAYKKTKDTLLKKYKDNSFFKSIAPLLYDTNGVLRLETNSQAQVNQTQTLIRAIQNGIKNNLVTAEDGAEIFSLVEAEINLYNYENIPELFLHDSDLTDIEVQEPSAVVETKPLPVEGTKVTYLKKGQTEKKEYIVRDNKIFNNKGKEVYSTPSKDRNKILTNAEVKEGRAEVITIEQIESGEQVKNNYIINSEGKVISAKSGNFIVQENIIKAVKAKSKLFQNLDTSPPSENKSYNTSLVTSADVDTAQNLKFTIKENDVIVEPSLIQKSNPHLDTSNALKPTFKHGDEVIIEFGDKFNSEYKHKGTHDRPIYLRKVGDSKAFGLLDAASESKPHLKELRDFILSKESGTIKATISPTGISDNQPSLAPSAVNVNVIKNNNEQVAKLDVKSLEDVLNFKGDTGFPLTLAVSTGIEGLDVSVIGLTLSPSTETKLVTHFTETLGKEKADKQIGLLRESLATADIGIKLKESDKNEVRTRVTGLVYAIVPAPNNTFYVTGVDTRNLGSHIAEKVVTYLENTSKENQQTALSELSKLVHADSALDVFSSETHSAEFLDIHKRNFFSAQNTDNGIFFKFYDSSLNEIVAVDNLQLDKKIVKDAFNTKKTYNLEITAREALVNFLTNKKFNIDIDSIDSQDTFTSEILGFEGKYDDFILNPNPEFKFDKKHNLDLHQSILNTPIKVVNNSPFHGVSISLSINQTPDTNTIQANENSNVETSENIVSFTGTPPTVEGIRDRGAQTLAFRDKFKQNRLDKEKAIEDAKDTENKC
jgi:hypothetical protein